MTAKFKIEEKKSLFRKQRWYVYLVAGNGEIVAVGEPYVSESNAKRGCFDIKVAAAEAEVL